MSQQQQQQQQEKHINETLTKRLEILSFAAKKAEDNQNAVEALCLYRRLVAEIQYYSFSMKIAEIEAEANDNTKLLENLCSLESLYNEKAMHFEIEGFKQMLTQTLNKIKRESPHILTFLKTPSLPTDNIDISSFFQHLSPLPFSIPSTPTTTSPSLSHNPNHTRTHSTNNNHNNNHCSGNNESTNLTNINVNLSGQMTQNISDKSVYKNKAVNKTIENQDFELNVSKTSSSMGRISKRQRNTFYGKSDDGRENDDIEMASSPTTQNNEQKKEFKSALEKFEEDQILKGQLTLKNTRSQVLGKRKRGFVPPFKRDSEDDGVTATSSSPSLSSRSKVARDKDISENPYYKNIDPEMIERIENEILDIKPNIHFDDIAGLEDVKRTLNEMIIQPNKRPDLFKGLRAPPKGLLLFGPPGNGKTLIAKAVATEAGLTFFAISASSLTSKWIGEGEKMVKALFAVARSKQPSFIFIDEIDAILCSRSIEEHESSRRLKNEFLTQFEGATTSTEDRITVMGATNRPQDLDEAARRRFSKRIYVPLPGIAARKRLIMQLLQNEDHELTEQDFDTVAKLTEGYSCHDISSVCKDAAMAPLRECGYDIVGIERERLRPFKLSDFINSLQKIRPSVAPEECKAYEEWNQKFGNSSF